MLPKLPEPEAWVLPPESLLALFPERPQPASASNPTTVMTANTRFPASM
jgi:hypothetical protein